MKYPFLNREAESSSHLHSFFSAVVGNSRLPGILIDKDLVVKAVNRLCLQELQVEEEELLGSALTGLANIKWEAGKIDFLVEQVLHQQQLRDFQISVRVKEKLKNLSVNATEFPFSPDQSLILLSIEPLPMEVVQSKEKKYAKLLNEVLAQAPALMCTLKGPNHIFELANKKYLELVGNREIIGKSVKEVMPEVENQGFIDMLDGVYSTGKPYIGNSISLSMRRNGKMENFIFDFIYQPIRNEEGEVEGIFVHAIDVTERVVNRKKLEESENELRNLIDTVPVIIWIIDEQGNSSFLNKNWYSYTGQKPAEAEGLGWLTPIHSEDLARVRESFQRAVKAQEFFSATYRLRTKEGIYKWVLTMGQPKWDSQGNFQGMVGSVVDVHEDRVKEELLREKEHRIRSIVEEATVATALYTGKEMKIELANDAMLELWGKKREVVGKKLRDALPELEGQPFHDLLERVYTTGEMYWGKEDKAELLRNGKLETGYFNFTYKALRNEKGEIYGILNMAVDVSEMVHSKALSREREAHFRQLADLMPEKVTNSDAKGAALYFNQNWLDFTGLTSEQLKTHGWIGFIHPDDKEEFEERWQESLATGSDFEMEIRIRDLEGNYQWHLSRAEAVKNAEGEIKMWIASSTEIQRLKEEEQRKESFLKMVSHELKTPVTSIKGYIQLLLSMIGKLDEPKFSSLPLKPSLERIDHQIGRLTRLISEMLDLSRIEDNKLELQKSSFSINELVDETVQDIILTNTQHKIFVSHNFRCRVIADKDRIGQVLINFITNAIKYSPESQQVEILVEATTEDEVVVRVRDKGIGIDKKDQKKIFQRFYRIGGENEETYSGFGIGLYLANEIVQRHNGSIEVKSKKGKGSEFNFKLKIEKN